MLPYAQRDSEDMESAGFQEEGSAGILEGKLPTRYLWKGGDLVEFENILKTWCLFGVSWQFHLINWSYSDL